MDHCDKEKREKNPRETANVFALLTFTYIGSIYKKAFKNELQDEDLYDVIKRCNSHICGDKLEKHWILEKEKLEKAGKPISLIKLMFRRWGKRYFLLGFVDFLYTTIKSILQPYAISQLISFFTPGQTTISRTDAYVYALMVLSLNIGGVIFMHNYLLWGQTFGMEIKTAFSSLLYRKALKLSPAALSETTLGNIVTLITKDVQILRMSIWAFNDIWIATTQVIVICTLLYIKVGPTSFFGVGILLSALPLQAFLGKCVTSLRLQTSKKTDQRLELTQEVLSTMRIIKMYTWEAFFVKKITYARRKEVLKILLAMLLRMVITLIGGLFSKVGFYVVIAASIWAGVSVNTTTIFYALSNFRDLYHWLGQSLPYTMGQIGEFLSAYKRIVKTLAAEELSPDFQDDKPTEKPMVQLNEATVEIQQQTILKNVSFKIFSGLTLITGIVGSGKSSVLRAVLQDYPLAKGSVKTQGRIAYASQEPWLFPSSIKQNILFGENYDEKRYKEVIRVCALLYDFNLLEKGDETIVSDRGLNLSKGQQARINLARAIYRDTEIYLLDDCLTALDTSVKDYIFNNCIKTFLKGKICILVSQTARHIQEADNVLIMQNGSIKDFDAPSEKILEEINGQVLEEDNLEKKVIEEEEEEDENLYNEETGLIETEQITAKKKVYQEIKKEGSVNIDVYKKYVLFGGGFLLLCVNITGTGLTQFAASFSDKLLTSWTDNKQTVLALQVNLSNSYNTSVFNNSLLEEAQRVESSTFKLYSIMILVAAGMELLRNILIMDFCRRASINIHKEMINNIFNAVMSFFDTHLIGNVLNRFSQDLVNIDELLSDVLAQCFEATFSIAGGLFLIISVNLTFGFYITAIFIILIILRWIYIPAGRSLKRLEAAARSPMLGHLNATLEGLTTIRACKVEDLLIEEYDKHQNLYTSAHYMSTCASRALGFFMDSVCTSLVVVVVVRFLFFDTGNILHLSSDGCSRTPISVTNGLLMPFIQIAAKSCGDWMKLTCAFLLVSTRGVSSERYKVTTAGAVGLALTQVIGIGRQVQWGIRQWTELENLMTSTERLLEYTEIKNEQKHGAAVANWPSEGSISYEKVSLSYNNSNDYVLNNLNFEIKPKEKIGIVGRTGAGKSSIISTIFRLYEVEGNILIDGINIKTLSLDFLRKSIAIIPQDPILFSGTIRSNLDPLGEFEDTVLWETLEKVAIKHSITSLDQIVNSSSLNFSSGQKQLICLSRAILRKARILIMDEATANMDTETDRILHDIIKNNFSNSTVLIIAHKLHSILGCDKVMVLNRGEIQEFDRPSNLLENKHGFFYKMVKQSGLLNSSG